MNTQPSSHALLRNLIIATAFSLVLATLLHLPQGNLSGSDWAVGGVTLLTVLLIAGFLYRGKLIWAAHFYAAVFWLAITASLVIYEIYRIPTPGVYFVIVLVVLLLLRGRAVLFYAALSLVASLSIIVATEIGNIPLYQPTPDYLPSVTNTYPKTIIAFSLLGSVYHIFRHTLATLRFNETSLQEIRQSLGEQTTALSQANSQLRHEISEREQTEAALEQQRAFLRQIIDTIPHYVFVKDADGRYLITNKELAAAFKRTPEELEGRSGQELSTHTEEFEKFAQDDQAVLATMEEKSWPDVIFTDLYGVVHRFHVVKRPLHDATSNITYVMGIATDVTLLRTTTEALREKEEHFRTLVEASFDGIIITVNHVIQQANISFAVMFGYTAVEELLGRSIRQFINLENRAPLQNMKRNQKISLEAEGIRQDGSAFPIELVSQTIDYHGQVAQISGVQDITVRKQAEEAEKHAQKLESLSIMAGGLAHDFNNLLVAMLGQISIAKAKIVDDHPSHGNLDKATQATETAALLTRQLLAYTGRGHFEVTSINLNNLISQNLQLFQDSLPQNITFQTSLYEPLPCCIRADGAQIQQVIMNLMLNAAQAIGTKPGTITITTKPYNLTNGEIDQWQQANDTLTVGNFVLLEVVDTGHGMDEATLNRVFDPFFSTKGTGRGLGLAAVLGIVRGHKGSVRAKSQPGQGTSFQFLFPMTETEPEEVEMTIPPTQSNDHIVLVIDDEEQVREALSDILDLEDIGTASAIGGREGIAMFEANRGKIGLIILDLSMPGMNGMETFVALKEIDPNVKIILSSGYTETEALQKMAGVRPTGFLQKPYRIDTVLHMVKKHLD